MRGILGLRMLPLLIGLTTMVSSTFIRKVKELSLIGL